jgi:thiosulfate dehydrogenase
MENSEKNYIELGNRALKTLNALIVLLMLSIAGFTGVLLKDFLFTGDIAESQNIASVHALTAPPDGLWHAPDIKGVGDGSSSELIIYGRDLIASTSKFLGPNGSVKHISNGLNCQNCHLDAGTRPWGNNYGSVASTYPKFRARSGSVENIYKRVNDCFERSLNGQALDTLGKEMQAIKAYIEFLGSNVEKGKKAEGSGFKELAFLDRPADPSSGKVVYELKCQSCHQPDGEGTLMADGSAYTFPPLWGEHSYNDGAGLYRITNFARYVKYNMPLGATHAAPMLTDEEAWDVAAFVNSQKRPHIDARTDWPDISKKPIDHPFGPYDDGFSEAQHKYGPWKPIQDFRNGANTAMK